MKAIEILGMGWDNGYITFSTTDGRDGRVYFSTVADAMMHYGGSFASCLGRAWTYADGTNSKIIFDSFGRIIKDYIERFVYYQRPDIISNEVQD